MLVAINKAAESINDFDMTDVLDTFKDLVRSSIIFTNKDDMDTFVETLKNKKFEITKDNAKRMTNPAIDCFHQ